ncbi:MAG: PT domain-containing protein [Fibrobacter sp.]|nr:PT domain-containing protein [Fibrobacter sp.]
MAFSAAIFRAFLIKSLDTPKVSKMSIPSARPSARPSANPSARPSANPSARPSANPSARACFFSTYISYRRSLMFIASLTRNSSVNILNLAFSCKRANSEPSGTGTGFSSFRPSITRSHWASLLLSEL